MTTSRDFITLAQVLVFALFLLTGLGARAQTITQIIDASGDGSGHTLGGPIPIAIDASGNVYVGGAVSDNAFKITPTGVITQIIDATGDGLGHTFRNSFGIAVDAAGSVYVAGSVTNNAFKITSSDTTQIIDVTGDGLGHIFASPRGIAVDTSGNVYVTGWSTSNAFKITPTDTTRIISATGDGTNPLDFADGIAVDAAGNVYVAGSNSSNAFKITPAGAITQIIDATGDGLGHTLNFAQGIAVDTAGNVYVGGATSSNAFKITPAGAITQIIDATGDGLGHTLLDPRAIAVDVAGNVYVSGYDSWNAFRITPAGAITQIIDATGDGLGHALRGARGIAADASGSVYVVGSNTSNAFKIEFDDDDEDGISNADDLCPGTVIPEASVPSKGFLGKLRWALFDGDTAFDTYDPKGHATYGYNTEDTGGCSCEQIIPLLDLGGGAVKAGCDVKGMDAWVAYVNSLGKGAAFTPGIAVSGELPGTYALEGNYPNPFNPSTTLRFDVPEDAHVLLTVYDLTGREVARLLDQTVDAGTHDVRWDASSAPSGTYFYRLTAGSFSETKVMTLLR